MSFLKRLRPLFVFLIVGGVGVAAILIATGDSEKPPRRGIRIRTVTAHPAESVQIPALPIEGLPALLAAEAPEVTKFETILLPGPEGPTKVKFLAWHLKVGEMEVETQRALAPVFSLFPAPASLEQAQAFLAAPTERDVEIRSDEARIARGRRLAPTGGDDLPDQWVLTLADNVHVTSRREGRRIELTGDHLEVEATDRRVRAVGPVEITADEYTISGRGLSGDAGLGTFSVEEDVEVVLPTAALASGTEVPKSAMTRISCRGPLTVERLGKNPETGAMKTRVRFAGAVHVASDGEEGRPPDVIDAEELEILLVVISDKSAEGNAVTVTRVEADGDVVMTRGEESRAECAGLVIDRLVDGDDVTMAGPVKVRHEGLLPVSVGGEAAESARLTVDASGGARLVTKGDDSNAVFTGEVVAKRLGPDDEVQLELGADQITLESTPERGDSMIAEGGAAFSTPAATGSAERIEWSRTPKGREVTTLDGSPTVELAGGGGFDLFQAAPSKPEEKEGAKELLILKSEGRMELVTEGEVRTFLMTDEVSVVREREGIQLFRVGADKAEGTIVADELERLTANGAVVASGRDEKEGQASYFASGESLTYLADKEDATLSGSPAMVRLIEAKDRTNEITALRLTFKSGGSLLTAEEEVKAVVFLPGEKVRETRPYMLQCDRLEVVPADGESTKEIGPGRIASLVASGKLALSGRDRTAHGARLTYTGLGTRELVLTGAPAFLTQRQDIGGTVYEDRYESTEFRLKLLDRDIDSFIAPRGGSFTLFRPYGKGTPSILGTPSTGGGAVERLTGSASRTLYYDTRTARMNGRARIEQAVGSASGFRSVGVFTCEELVATRGIGPSGRPELLTVRGRGGVHGTGDNWELRCETFDADLVKHKTRVVGDPVEFTQRGYRQLVREATYDYEENKWEMVGLRSR